MLTWLARLLLIAGGVIAGWFVSPEAHNFEIMRMIFAILLLVLFVAAAAYWPRRRKKKTEPQP